MSGNEKGFAFVCGAFTNQILWDHLTSLTSPSIVASTGASSMVVVVMEVEGR